MAHSVNEQKFLVTWVEAVPGAPDFVRGQATKTREDATRLFNHAVSLNTTLYAEIRRIGSKLSVFERKAS